MHPKDADGMANSVDPDQTASSEAVWSWSALFAETYLSQYIEFVRYYLSRALVYQLEQVTGLFCKFQGDKTWPHFQKKNICKIKISQLYNLNLAQKIAFPNGKNKSLF